MKMPKQFGVKIIIISAIAFFSGCGIDSDMLSDVSGGSGSGTDSLQLIKMDNTNFKIVWNKGYSGYSEAVVKTEDEPSDSRGTYFLTGNSNGKYILECSENVLLDDRVGYDCKNLNPNAAPMYREIELRFEFDKTYNFFTSVGLEHQQTKAGSLKYDSSANMLIINN